MRRLLQLGVIALSAIVLLGAGEGTRFDRLGHELICSCGCNQILLDCNHVGCPASEGMRNQLKAAIDRGDSREQVLQGFVSKYGPTILSAPTGGGFNRLAWIMPFVVLAAGLAFFSGVISAWRRKQVSAIQAASDPGLDAFRRQARQETQS